MSDEYELSNWEKFCIISWKNFLVAWKNYKQSLGFIFFPPALLIVLVIFRSLVDVTRRPTKQFRKVTINSSWQGLLEEMEMRREEIRLTLPEFDHNPYVPQPIVAFAPNDNRFETIMENAVSNYIKGVGLLAFKTCQELRDSMIVQHYFAGVCFEFDADVPTKMETVIVFPSELRLFNDSHIGASWSTNVLYDKYNSFEVRQLQSHRGGYVGYIREGFAAIQNAVSLAFIKSEFDEDLPNLKLCRFPVHSHMDDSFIRNTQVSISLFLVCGYLFPAFGCTTKIVQEKNSEVKKVFKSMGVGNFIHIASWFTMFFILLSLSSVLITIILKISWHNGRGILPHTSAFVLLLVLLAYNTASISFCIMMSTFFSDVSVAVPVTGATWIFSYIPYIASTMTTKWSWNLKPFMCLFCNTVLALIFDEATAFENDDDGLRLTEMAPSSFGERFMTSGALVGLLFALSFIYILVALYMEKTKSKIVSSLWKLNIFRTRRESRPRTSGRRQTVVNEIEPEYKDVIVKVENLSKIFKDGFAMKHLNVNFFKGDITVFMGHNGSGKTVLLELIAGFLEPTTGKITIKGLDAIKYKSAARYNMGVCIHEGLLFDELSVVDQLTLFGRLRGLRTYQLEKEVKRYIDAMSLTHRRRLKTNKLSPGERRFLAVCCALIGNCKIVLLDEPSHNLDILQKISLWDLLRAESRWKTIIIASHSEEEAEALGDRIGILSGGELKCFGSTFFLKKVYGQGHRLVLFKQKEFPKEPITNLILSHVPNASFELELGSQITYMIEGLGQFANLFDDLESHAEELGIKGISVSEINASDIFLKMGVQDNSDIDRHRQSETHSRESAAIMKIPHKIPLDGGVEKVTGFKLFLNHFEVLLVKRANYSLHNFLVHLLKLIMPVIFVTVSFALLYKEHKRQPLRRLSYDLRHYPNSVTAYHISHDAAFNEKLMDIYNGYGEHIFEEGLNHKVIQVKEEFANFNEFIIERQGRKIFQNTEMYIVGMSITENLVTAYFNNHPLHTVPLSLNLAHNAILRSLSSIAKLKVTFDPLPFDTIHNRIIKTNPTCIGTFLAIVVSFCLGFMLTSSVIFFVRERRVRFKNYQYFCGVQPYVFWLTTFLYDVLVIIITTLLLILTIAVFETEMFTDEVTSGVYFFILLMAGIGMCSGNYLTSLLYDRAVLAYASITMFHIFGTMTYWAYVETFHGGGTKSYAPNHYVGILRIFPYFSVCNALYKCFNMAELSKLCSDPGTEIISVTLMKCNVPPRCCTLINIWDFNDGVWIDLMFIFGFGIICWAIIFVMESFKGFRSRMWCPASLKKFTHFEKGDVSKIFQQSRSLKFLHENNEREEQEVLSINPLQDKSKALVCKGVCAKIGKSFYLNYITFAVNWGEIFAIVGENGSGKTSLTNCLLGQAPIKSGKIYINRMSLHANIYKIYARISLCKQGDTFLNEYTIYEIIRLTCLLRGIPNYQIRDMCEYLGYTFGFSTHLRKQLKFCTPGIKKRFACACALIGCPDLVIFDEPMSSLDLAGQRQLLKVFCEMREKGQTIVLTSQTPQNCESIVDHLMVLSRGHVVALSDPWHLSKEYSKCYLLKMKVKKLKVAMPEDSDWNSSKKRKVYTSNPVLNLADFIETKFPSFKLKGQLGNIIEYFIPVESTSMSFIYKIMQRHSFNLCVEDFSISTATLSGFCIDVLESSQYHHSL